MAFFGRKRKGTIEAKVKVADVFVTTCVIISSYDDGAGYGPRCVTMYFLAKCEGGEYYELFSGTKLEKEKESKGGIRSQMFDTPYVEKSEPLTKYLKNPDKKTIGTQDLFNFITYTNVIGILGAFPEDKEDDEEEC